MEPELSDGSRKWSGKRFQARGPAVEKDDVQTGVEGCADPRILPAAYSLINQSINQFICQLITFTK